MKRTELTGNYSVAALVDKVRQRLSEAGTPEPAIEARLLVQHALETTREKLLVSRSSEVSERQAITLEQIVGRRLKREPLQYITGEVEFYGRLFSVDSRVLIPRPETELLVEQALFFANEHTRGDSRSSLRVLDIGTGSGALAITLAAEISSAVVTATDISGPALEVARHNAEIHGVQRQITFIESSGADGVKGKFDLLLCNPPYVLRSYLDGGVAQPELSFEPRMALDGGPDGLDFYRPLLGELSRVLDAGAAAFIEVDPPVAESCLTLARTLVSGAVCEVLTDYSGLERCLVVSMKD